jgi:hypothetical protein
MVISFLLLVFGFMWWRNAVSRLRTVGVEAQAEVTGAVINKEGRITSSLRFTDLDGVTHNVTHRSKTYHKGLRTMEYGTRTIVYDPGNPEFLVMQSEFNDFIYPTGWQVLLMIIGSIGGFGIAYMLLSAYKS